MSDFETISSLVTDKIIFCGVLVADLHPADFYVPEGEGFPVITDLVFHIIVQKGCMKITVDGFGYECTPDKNNMVDVKPMNRVGSISLSDDFSGWLIVLSRPFLDTVLKGRNPIRISEILSQKVRTAVTVSSSDMARIERYYANVKEGSEDGADRLEMAIFCYSVLVLHLNVIRIIRSGRPETMQVRYSRTEMILEQFYRLLIENVEKEHEVGFYADKLCITPHYLTIVANRYTGKSASRIISEELLTVACRLLKNPDLTIQDVADRLRFSDQSSFGKFFRKHSGTTPAAYRKNFL